MKRVVGLVVGLLGVAAGRAEAAPARVSVPRLEVLKLPVNGASVVAELIEGAPVCVVEEASYPRPLHRRPGWLAVLIGSGVGYASTEAVQIFEDAAGAEICGRRQAEVGAAMVAAAARGGGAGSVSAAGAAGTAGAPGSPAGAGASTGVGGVGGVGGVAAGTVGAIFEPIEAAGSFMPLAPARVSLGAGTGAAWLQGDEAKQQGIGGTGITINVSAGLTLYDVFTVSATGGAAFPSDDASFRQEVEPVEGGGGSRTVESSLEVQSYSLAAGARTPFLVLSPRGANGSRGVAGALFADFGTSAIRGSRTITNCVDCRSDDIELSGGSFVRFGFDVVSTSSSRRWLGGLNVAYQQYLGDATIASELRIGCMFWL